MQVIEVVASPAERWALFEIVFQTGPRALSLGNGAEGRAFRSFAESMGLVPIREALARFGSVSTETSQDETFRVFHLSPEAVKLYREKIADLPRSALQELVGGSLLTSLHGLGGPFHREGSFALPAGWKPVMWWPDGESWAPEVDVPAGVADVLRMRVRAVQDAIDRFQAATENMDVPFSLRAELLRFHEAILLGIKEALEAPEAAAHAHLGVPSTTLEIGPA